MLLMRAIILNDNVGAPGLLNEWGWSLYIEANGRRVLFDADTSPEVISYNAKRLGVDFSFLDFGFLSHHHGDHYGGFSAVAKAKPGLPVYAPPGETSWAHGLPLALKIVREPGEIAPGFYSSGPLEAWTSFYEQALGISLGDRLVVIVGCSHPGVDTLAEKLYSLTGLPILMVIGGFHEPETWRLDKLADLADYICPAHCSGSRAKHYVATRYPEKFCNVKTGSTITITSDYKIIIRNYE
ncbi:MBL fold metallo-hydrolase [Pyrofollis japonicus]|uniref:MBL fold metallo-hydrolase n=1 Tax=Pyrofollis japonicus TaxID=3060460 RepID=UPI00295B2319|nr:MBL fold metallo-hydrolase [Pyrofollis japonicus]BEP18608.1 MBL fold metallo-hydrolase [Pyrofollis japonicus]